MRTQRLILIALSAALVNSGCVSRQAEQWSQISLRNGIANLRKGCQLNARSGFTAELSLTNQGTTRIDAAWDNAGHLNGQVVNALGEDLINFKIDGSGILQTDLILKKEVALGSALEFLAELGTAKTRLLLCSGLFLAGNENHAKSFGQESSIADFDVQTHTSHWRVDSKLKSVHPDSARPDDEIKIITKVKTAGAFFSRAVASIEWSGKKKEGLLRPEEMTIQAGTTKIKLSFLDFE